jgi:hypothetical protein
MPSNPDDQVLSLCNERFAVPEVLFRPTDVGLTQAGLCESIVAAVEACPTWMHGLMYENVMLVGGNVRLPNFAARIEKDLRPLVPIEYKIAVKTGKEYGKERTAELSTSNGLANSLPLVFSLYFLALLRRPGMVLLFWRPTRLPQPHWTTSQRRSTRSTAARHSPGGGKETGKRETKRVQWKSKALFKGRLV